jgi:O-antigen ligase
MTTLRTGALQPLIPRGAAVATETVSVRTLAAPPSLADLRPRGPLFWAVVACMPVLMVNAFDMPGRATAQNAASLDPLGLVKLATRLGSLLLLGWLVLSRSEDARRRTVLARLVPYAVFVLWALASASWSALPQFAVGQVLGQCVLWGLAVAVGLCGRGAVATKSVLASLTLATLAFSTVTLACRLALPGLCPLDRGVDGMIHPTTAASAASLGAVLLIACRLIWNWKWTRPALVPGLMVHLALIYFAANRTSLVLTVLLGFGLLAAFGDRKLAAAIVAGCLGGAVYLTCDPQLDVVETGLGSTAKYVKRGAGSDLKDLSGRSELWQVIWKSYRQSPWIGHGYMVSSAKGELYAWYAWGNWTAHNVVLQALVSTGVVGLVLLAGGVFAPVLALVRSRPRGHACQVALFAAFLGAWFAVWGMFNESFLGPVEPEPLVFFTTLGLVVAHGPSWRPTTGRGGMPSPRAASA